MTQEQIQQIVNQKIMLALGEAQINRIVLETELAALKAELAKREEAKAD